MTKEIRQIKFRAWIKNDKIMAGEFDIDGFYQNSLLPLEVTSYGKLKKINYVLMQFIGLKDKNKKEIYDGDILEFWIGGQEIFRELYVLSYSEERACWQINIIKKCNHMNSPQFYSEHLTQTHASCMKVIGNIYENKELLRKEK